jgi:hypothetical protein
LIAALILGALALGIGTVGLARPLAMRWLYVGAMIVAFPIGWTVSRAVLALLFYALFTPVAMLFRLMGRDALRLRPGPELPTYWSPKLLPSDSTRYFHQY